MCSARSAACARIWSSARRMGLSEPPDRLRELVNLNFDKLKLVPFGADQFVDVGQVAFPAPARHGRARPETAAIERPAWYPPRRPKESTP